MSLLFEHAALFPDKVLEQHQQCSSSALASWLFPPSPRPLSTTAVAESEKNPRKRIKRDTHFNSNRAMTMIDRPGIQVQTEELVSLATKHINSSATSITCWNKLPDGMEKEVDRLHAKVEHLEALQRRVNEMIQQQLVQTKKELVKASLGMNDDAWMIISDYLSDQDLLNLQDAVTVGVANTAAASASPAELEQQRLLIPSLVQCWENPHRHAEQFGTGVLEHVHNTRTTRKQRAIYFRQASLQAQHFQRAAKQFYYDGNGDKKTAKKGTAMDGTDLPSSLLYASWPTSLYSKDDFSNDFREFRQANHRQQPETNNKKDGGIKHLPQPTTEFFVRVTYDKDMDNESVGNGSKTIVLLEGFNPPIVEVAQSNNSESYTTMGGFGSTNPYMSMRFPQVPTYDPKIMGIVPNEDEKNCESGSLYWGRSFLEQWPPAARKDFLNRISVTVLACRNHNLPMQQDERDYSSEPFELVVSTKGYSEWDLDMGLLQPRRIQVSCYKWASSDDGDTETIEEKGEEVVNVGLRALPSSHGFGILVQWGPYDDW